MFSHGSTSLAYDINIQLASHEPKLSFKKRLKNQLQGQSHGYIIILINILNYK